MIFAHIVEFHRQKMSFKRHENNVDYLILNTGFTKRLAKMLAKDPKKAC